MCLRRSPSVLCSWSDFDGFNRDRYDVIIKAGRRWLQQGLETKGSGDVIVKDLR